LHHLAAHRGSSAQFRFPVLRFRFGAFPLADIPINLGELLPTLSVAAMGLEVNVSFLAPTGGRAVPAGTVASVILCGTQSALGSIYCCDAL